MTPSLRLDDAAPFAIDDVSVQASWAALRENTDAVLVDVRSAAEWQFSGLPDLRELGKKTLTISLKTYPGFQDNPDFLHELAEALPDMSVPVYFICKTGGRSKMAAGLAKHAGYQHVYNVKDGFEGDRNQQGQRGQDTGWKAAKLPWEQV